MVREQITDASLEAAITAVHEALEHQLKVKGSGAFVSSHEILGVVTEEYHELVGTVTTNNKYAMREELLDLVVGCLFAIACIKQGTLDW